jgi:CheY-like chemotaxis protein
MAYLFKIRYSTADTNKGFVIQPDSSPIARVLHNKLKEIENHIENASIENKKDSHDFYIVYHNISDFFGDNGIKRRHLFAQYIYINEDELRDFVIKQNKERINSYLTNDDIFIDLINGGKKPFDTKTFPPLPMIHITAMDLIPFADDNPDYQQQKDALAKAAIIIPRYIKYLDSSIWNQYVPVEGKDFDHRLKGAIQNIVRFDSQKFYDDDKIRVIADFNARLLFNAHLQSEEDKHGSYVAPFIFHSETEMKTRASEHINDIKTKYKNGLKWRILLIDDKARDIEEGETPENSDINICKVLDKLKEELGLSIDWKCVKTLQEAQECLNAQRYDIVLLDYLLDYKGTGKDREYGYELLDKIHEKFVENKNSELQNESKGIFGKFWIMFISVFRNAVNGRLQEKGYTYNTDNWVIARGACPSTTPELFKYNLLSFMLLQLKTITSLSLDGEAQNKIYDNRRIITVKDLLQQIYNKRTLSEIRENAMVFFDALLRMRANYKVLRDDIDYNKDNNGGSELVRNVFSDIGKHNDAFWEHLMHLVYLTAFGTVRQWFDIEEEYWNIEQKLKDEKKFIKQFIEKLEKGQ